MDKMAAMRAFVAVVEEGGFAAAARALGLSRSVVNRTVIQLEDTLKTQLLTRNTRNVSPTETGLIYYRRVKTALDDIATAEDEIIDQSGDPRGILKINAPMSFGTLHLGPAVAEYLQEYPSVSIQLQLDDRFIDPFEDGFDITIRIANLADSSLIARRIAPVKMILAASPKIVDGAEKLRHPTDLQSVPCLSYGTRASAVHWDLVHAPSGESANVRVDGRLCSNNGEVLIEAAANGLGVIEIPKFMISEHLQAGTLVHVMPDWAPPDIAIHALYPPNRHVGPRVRTFIDFLVKRFGRNPDWQRTQNSSEESKAPAGL